MDLLHDLTSYPPGSPNLGTLRKTQEELWTSCWDIKASNIRGILLNINAISKAIRTSLYCTLDVPHAATTVDNYERTKVTRSSRRLGELSSNVEH
jgi:hypothetical protein